jgi:signal transduction histidine kinase
MDQQSLSAEGNSRRILIVEDDGDIRMSLESLLAGEGFEVNSCANGKEALAQLADASMPDLILLDLMMPVMDGWQFRIQQRSDPALAQIPVIAISADVSAKAVAVDAAAYLKKPFDYNTLISTIERVLLAFERRKLQHRMDEIDSQSRSMAQMERLRTAFIANISHEIRTPLNAVLSLSQLLRDGLAGPLLPDQRKYVDVIERNGQNVLNLLTDVIDLANLEAGMLELGVADLNIDNLIQSTAAEVRPLAEAKNLELVVDVAKGLPRVRADAFRARQVLRHLMLNAIKFTEEGTVKVVAADESGGFVAVHISDTGLGIPEGALSRIFEGFYQIDHRLGRRHSGAGLGLTLVDRLIKLMGGKVSVQSTVGAGSRFTITLPCGGKQQS